MCIRLNTHFMIQTPSPSTIISAAVVMQLFLALIAGIGAYVVDRSERFRTRFYENPLSRGRQAWVIVGFALSTLAVLVLSDGFAGSWRDLSGSSSFSIISWSHALLLVFFADIIWTCILVYQTSGSDRSAFTAIYFVLPSFAFFLRESPKRIILYAICVAICFSIGFAQSVELDSEASRFPFWLVSILCLMLSLLVGFMTRVK